MIRFQQTKNIQIHVQFFIFYFSKVNVERHSFVLFLSLEKSPHDPFIKQQHVVEINVFVCDWHFESHAVAVHVIVT